MARRLDMRTHILTEVGNSLSQLPRKKMEWKRHLVPIKADGDAVQGKNKTNAVSIWVRLFLHLLQTCANPFHSLGELKGASGAAAGGGSDDSMA